MNISISDAYQDFMLSRKAMQCTPATLSFYKYTAGRLAHWLEERITRPDEVTPRLIREYLASLTGESSSIHDHARAVRTLLRFWSAESYMPMVKIDMPRLAKKKLPVLTAEQLNQLLKACDVREKALVLFLADSGLRRAEVVKLNWRDVDMQSGLVRVIQGKGRKDRSSVVSATVRRALLKYRRTLDDCSPTAPLFKSERGGGRLTGEGVRLIFRRLSIRTGIKVTAHALRRTFTILSLRAGMSILHLQSLGGWSSLDMVQHYAQLTDADLLQEHSNHSAVESL